MDRLKHLNRQNRRLEATLAIEKRNKKKGGYVRVLCEMFESLRITATIKITFRECSLCGETKTNAHFIGAGKRCASCRDNIPVNTNPNKRLDYTREYRKNPEYKIRRNEQMRNRRKTDPLFKLRANLRGRVLFSINRGGFVKKSKTRDIVGCSYKTLVSWLESKFTEGMSWDNYGEWHIDHKKPLATGKTESEILALCHYTNLQPLWALDNLKKGARY